MGLVTEGDRFAVLTDILGKEDAFGDMDFKVTGTARRHHGAPDGHQGPGHQRGDHPHRACEKARVARLIILDKMTAGHPDRPRRR